MMAKIGQKYWCLSSEFQQWPGVAIYVLAV